MSNNNITINYFNFYPTNVSSFDLSNTNTDYFASNRFRSSFETFIPSGISRNVYKRNRKIIFNSTLNQQQNVFNF